MDTEESGHDDTGSDVESEGSPKKKKKTVVRVRNQRSQRHSASIDDQVHGEEQHEFLPTTIRRLSSSSDGEELNSVDSLRTNKSTGTSIKKCFTRKSKIPQRNSHSEKKLAQEKKSPSDEIDLLVGRLPDEPLVSSPIPASTIEPPINSVSSVR